LNAHLSAARAILHVDMDAFYAAIEQRDAPALKGQPVIVAGLGRRGVVSTCSYEARRFGVHSAMPTARARELCPEGVFLTPRMKTYVAASAAIFAIFARFTPEIEGLSLDEAFLDVSASRSLFGSPHSVAVAIKRAISAETGLTASVGIASNKFIAKLASERSKPDGLLEIPPEHASQFLRALPIGAMWGVGRVSEPRLRAAGIATLADLIDASPARLRPLLGRDAERLQALARGEDERPVLPERAEKSIGAEETFERDLTDLSAAERELLGLSERVAGRLRSAGLQANRLILKVRVPPFETHTLSLKLDHGVSDTRSLYLSAKPLLERWWKQAPKRALRLLGLSAQDLREPAQDDLFAAGGLQREDAATDQVVDRIRKRFGESTLSRARRLPNPGEKKSK